MKCDMQSQNSLWPRKGWSQLDRNNAGSTYPRLDVVERELEPVAVVGAQQGNDDTATNGVEAEVEGVVDEFELFEGDRELDGSTKTAAGEVQEGTGDVELLLGGRAGVSVS